MNESSSTQPRPASRLWVVAALTLVLLIMSCGLIWFVIAKAIDTAHDLAMMPQQTITRIAQAFAPTVHVTTAMRTAIGEIRSTPKMVVTTVDVDAEVVKARGTEWGYMYWGTTTVTLRAHHNRIQYVVPTGHITADNFVYDSGARELKVIIPPPMVDPDFVDVQSDPKEIEIKTDLGWAHFDKWTGDPLRQEARHDLRQAVIAAGRHELLITRARVDARAHFEKLLSPMAHQLAPGVRLRVVFNDEAQ